MSAWITFAFLFIAFVFAGFWHHGLRNMPMFWVGWFWATAVALLIAVVSALNGVED